ncbi:GTPase-activating protein isoform X1 [Tribolium castaneum]|uniref:GTPase-activating protein 1 n=1 Tax=Tribolium castaneum TaxID=7070 RepID=D6WKV4_TRICA|nr:PREDICTED: GTPase-activating protein isoform X2 [Tribolium castaneum]EFA04666.1 GTPase-activating protein 1 [Tribolium castaneum]|eukprot:XP_967172.1 PREDICTED: GTPase-activating protein isoform X2 [Tribolium castaneum]
MADVPVRVEERLKIKIGEAKQLQPRSNLSSVARDVYCILSLDQEEIYRTKTAEKTLNPFFGEEYQFEVPRDFRFISIYLFDRDKHLKQNKVLGKVAIKREELSSYNNRDHWFAIKPVDADSEVQGKVNIELKFSSSHHKSKWVNCYSRNDRLSVQVVKCLDLTLKNGACDPYAVACVTYTNRKTVSKRTKVRKKTTCPQFDEIFIFDGYEGRDKDMCGEEVEICELNVSIWHDAPGMGDDVFLGEVRVQLSGIQQQNAAPRNAWYFLQPRSAKNRPSFTYSTPPGTRLSKDNSLGSLRLQVQYNEDRVFPAEIYESLKHLLLKSVDTKPITSSAVYVLGEIISSKMEIAQPLVRIFMHHGQIVPIIKALADAEISMLTDPTTIFRGNTLVSKMMDEAMRLIGLQYLHKTLRPTIELIFSERKPCEIDPTRVRDSNTVQTNLNNLKTYVLKVFKAITQSAIHCPALMCQIFYNLKECAMKRFPENKEVRYSVISGFIFLRFFAPAILGPRLFDLTNEQIDSQINRTLTLISKTIQSLGNLVSCRSSQQVCKEEYMESLYKEFYTETHVTAVRQFLEIISAISNPENRDNDTPVTLKEGLMIKRAQGRKRFGRKNFKQRYFKLTTHNLSYAKSKGKEALCQIPLSNILAVERLTEKSFKMKNMFQIVQDGRTLYVQAANCVEEKEWVDLLTKMCQNNQNRLNQYHPSAFINGRWSCCESPNELAPGCSKVSSNDSNNFHITLDPERELQRIHSLIMSHMNQLELIMCQPEAFMKDILQFKTYGNHDVKQFFKVVSELRDVAAKIDAKHKTYMRTLARDTKYGSLAAPIGDDNYLLASRMNLDSLLSRR